MKELLLPLLILVTTALALKDDQQPIDNNLLPEAMKHVDVNRTVEEVQSILSKNTSLPRLTRGEILALLQDVTKNAVPQNLHERKEKKNDLLLVMPIKVNGNNLDNIYSVTPVTKLVRTGETDPVVPVETTTKPYQRVTQKPGKPRRRRPSSTTERSKINFSLANLIRSSTTQSFTKASSTSVPVTTMRPLFLNYVTRLPSTNAPDIKGQNFELPDSIKTNLQAFNLAKTQFIGKNKNTSGTDTSKNNFQLIQNISFDSPVQDFKFGMGAVSTAVRVSDEIPAVEQSRPVFNHPPMISLTDPNDKTVDKTYYNHKTKPSEYSHNQFENDDYFLSSTKSSKVKSKTTSPATSLSTTTELSIGGPSDTLTSEMKEILVSLGLLNPETGKLIQETPKVTTEQSDPSASIFNLKPMTPTVDPESYSKFKPIPLDDTSGKSSNMGISSDMKDFLASFGLLPDSSSSSKHFSHNYHENTHRGQKALQFNRDYINNETSSDFLSDLASLEQDSADSESLNDPELEAAHNVSLSTDMLSDDMKDVLQNLGLIEETMALKGNKMSKQHVFNPAVHTALLRDTTEAKKIKKLWHAITDLSKDNKTNELTQDELKMKIDNITTTVLSGNLTHESYIMKIINQNKNKANITPVKNETKAVENVKILTENVQEEIKDPAKDLEELENAGTEEIETEAVVKLEESNRTALEVEDQKESDEMEMMNTSANPTIVRPIAPSSGNLNHVMDGPDPLSSHELQLLLETNQRNEFKRQQPANDTDSTSTTVTETTSTSSTEAASGEVSSSTISSTSSDGISTTTSGDIVVTLETSTTAGDDEKAEMPSGTDSSPSASLDQLADSFGGGSVASAPPADEELPAATLRPNGLYFYVDWNTFLNVGEEDKKPVNLRFAPKVGNPRLFLPVTVP